MNRPLPRRMRRQSLPACLSPLLALALLAGCQRNDAGEDAAATVPAPTEVMAVSTPPPAYPAEVACTGGEGTSVLRVVIGPAGRVTQADVVTSSGFPALDQAAAEAVEGWQFRAATQAGKPVPSTIQVPVTFRLPPGLPSDCYAVQERLRRGG